MSGSRSGVQGNDFASVAALTRPAVTGGAPAWRLSVYTGGRTVSQEVAVERLTTWSGPCSNEIVYRCTMDVGGPAASAFASGPGLVTVEGRGQFAVRQIDISPAGAYRFELHRPF
jgi:hypothetical protein